MSLGASGGSSITVAAEGRAVPPWKLGVSAEALIGRGR